MDARHHRLIQDILLVLQTPRLLIDLQLPKTRIRPRQLSPPLAKYMPTDTATASTQRAISSPTPLRLRPSTLRKPAFQILHRILIMRLAILAILITLP